jgi:hypothetical protein
MYPHKQSLVPIDTVVSDMKILKLSPPFVLFLVTAAMLVGSREEKGGMNFPPSETTGPI